MKISLKTIKYYFLTCNNELRKNHMINEFKDYDITEVNPAMEIIGKHKSAPTGFSRIFDLASKNQDRTKPFQPFCMFEDDVKKYREFPETIEIPDDSDILYIGLSKCGINDIEWCNTVCYKNINNDIIKLENMLSLHGIIICSTAGLLAIQRCMLEGYYTDIVWDIFCAQIQPYYNVYALKKPLVYQYGPIGGQESATKFELNVNSDLEINPNWINKKNISVITRYLDNKNIKKENNVYLYLVGYEYKLIKILRELINLHSKDSYNVHLITKDNVTNYIKDLPSYFYDLQPNHQSDFVRINILCDKGGIWLDSDTIVMDNLSSLFSLFDKYDGFFIKENNEYLCSGVFGTKPNTKLMNAWKTSIINILNEKQTKIEWNEISIAALDQINKKFLDNYKIFNGLDNMYSINCNNCVNEFIIKPNENYKNIIREYQPLIILVNSVYTEYDKLSDDQISKTPLSYFLNKSKENYEKKIQNSYISYFQIANIQFKKNEFEEAIINYKNVIQDSKSNDEKYISCFRAYESLYKINKEQDSIYYLIKSFHYDKQRVECVHILVRYYNIIGLPDLAYSFYTIIRDYYENEFIKDYENLIKKLEVDINAHIFYLPYFMIIVSYKTNNFQTAIKMFEIIFNFKHIPDVWWLNNLLHNLNLYIRDVKKNKRRFYINCKEYLNLIKGITNINKDSINKFLMLIEEYNNKDYKLNFPIKIINLKRRTDRKEKLMTYLIKENVENYEFIEACDAYNLEPSKEIYNLFKDNDFKFSKGVIGCAYSHMNLWKQLVNDPNNDAYIILEDNAELTENINKKLKICYEEFLNNNMEILYLGSNSYTKRNTDINNLQFISRKQITTDGTYAYMISKIGAFKILNYIKNNGIKTAIDGPHFYNQLTSVNYTNESIIGLYFTFADSDIQRHTHFFNFDGIKLNY